MKFVFAVLLLAGLALAEPESTPDSNPEADAAAEAWRSYYGYGYGGYRGYGYGGYGGYYGYPGYGYGGYYRGKRDAEAKPAVLASSSALTTPQVVHPYGYAAGYGYGLPYAGHHAIPHAYTVSAPAVTHTVPAVTYTHPAAHVYHAGVYGFPHAYGGLYGYGLPVVAPAKEAERKKRDAESDPEATPEADPEAEAAADAWYGYYGRPGYYGHGYGYGGRRWGGYGGYYGGWGGYGLHGYGYRWGK